MSVNGVTNTMEHDPSDGEGVFRWIIIPIIIPIIIIIIIVITLIIITDAAQGEV